MKAYEQISKHKKAKLLIASKIPHNTGKHLRKVIFSPTRGNLCVTGSQEHLQFQE